MLKLCIRHKRWRLFVFPFAHLKCFKIDRMHLKSQQIPWIYIASGARWLNFEAKFIGPSFIGFKQSALEFHRFKVCVCFHIRLLCKSIKCQRVNIYWTRDFGRRQRRRCQNVSYFKVSGFYFADIELKHIYLTVWNVVIKTSQSMRIVYFFSLRGAKSTVLIRSDNNLEEIPYNVYRTTCDCTYMWLNVKLIQYWD